MEEANLLFGLSAILYVVIEIGRDTSELQSRI